ncbi:MAG: class I SAM-dependent methyltransferase [Chloroflexi bacterium]|nr:class I SAM-dependent methyltransferase [Chloroflexota bacterium]
MESNVPRWWRTASRTMLGSLSVGPRIRHAHLFSLMSPVQLGGLRILDAGCGDGSCALHLAQKFPTAHVTGIDDDPQRIQTALEAKRHLRLTNAEFRTQSLTEIQERAVFDIAYCVDVLEHIPDDVAAITNIKASLRPGGLLLVHVPTTPQKRYFPWLKKWSQDDHVRCGYDTDGIQHILRESGFELTAVRLTFGPFGALAWDIEESCRVCDARLRFLLLPVVLPLAQIELRFPNRWGNALMITARASAV